MGRSDMEAAGTQRRRPALLRGLRKASCIRGTIPPMLKPWVLDSSTRLAVAGLTLTSSLG